MKRIQLAIEGIVAASLATVACGETTSTSAIQDGGGGSSVQVFAAYPDQADFHCVDPLPELLDDVSPAEPVDFLEIRSQPITSDRDGGVHANPGPDGGTQPSFVSLRTKGTACATASDANACRAALAALPFDAKKGWTSQAYGGNVSPTREYAVYTRGNEVGEVALPSELVAFLGTVDTFGDAQLIAYVAGRATLSCDKPTTSTFAVPDPGWRRNADGSWEVIAVYGSCGPIVRDRYKVTATGELVVVDHTSFDTKDGPICGRRPAGLREVARAGNDVGAYFAEIAWLEAAAVVAFRGVERDLRALGAPEALLVATRDAQRDEIRHAREASELARRFGAEERALDVAPRAHRDRLAVARENAVEGCVREPYGALVAAYQAKKAEDPAVRRFFERIAGDEARHAELSHAIAAWLEPMLDPGERAQIAAAKAEALAELFESAGSAPGEFAALAGLPSARDARAFAPGDGARDPRRHPVTVQAPLHGHHGVRRRLVLVRGMIRGYSAGVRHGSSHPLCHPTGPDVRGRRGGRPARSARPPHATSRCRASRGADRSPVATPRERRRARGTVRRSPCRTSIHRRWRRA